MLLRTNERLKDGKAHRCWSTVAGCRATDNPTPPRQGPSLDELGDSQHAAWRQASDILHTAERLATTLAVRGGGAAATLLGGVPGALLGLGVGAWDATAYEQERPALEASLRSELELALRKTQWSLLSDRRQGVLAPIAHISEQLGAVLPAPSSPSTDDAVAPEALF